MKNGISDPVIDGNRIIHYCWFGGKPLTALARKCLGSWRKYLPGYRLVRWDETDFDVNINSFCAEAYRQKKWAFVADTARCYALKKYGGVYFDTDMRLTKSIEPLLTAGFAAGWESEYNVAAGFLWASAPENEILCRLWDYYQTAEYDEDNVYAFSIPTLLTGILQRYYGLEYFKEGIQHLRDGTVIYPADYFYPLSSDGRERGSENTCALHYYMGSWLPDDMRLRAKFKAALGAGAGSYVLDMLVFGKAVLRGLADLLLRPVKRLREKKDIRSSEEYLISDFDKRLSLLPPSYYVTIYNPDWTGTANAAEELFDSTLALGELYSDTLIDHAAAALASGFSLVIFSAFAAGWAKLAESIKEKNSTVKIKVLWHGSMALNSESYDFERFSEILSLYRRGIADSLGFVKRSMYEFFAAKGCRAEFVANRAVLGDEARLEARPKRAHEGLRIGIYASGDRWVKNTCNQLAAASLFSGAELRCIPLSDRVVVLSRLLNINISGSYTPVPRRAMLSELAANDINFYTTFTECAPLLPLESLELGVPCITGNNHHYWKGTELEKYLVVERVDDITEIYRAAVSCLENKDKIIDLYIRWREENIARSIESVNEFIKV